MGQGLLAHSMDCIDVPQAEGEGRPEVVGKRLSPLDDF